MKHCSSNRSFTARLKKKKTIRTTTDNKLHSSFISVVFVSAVLQFWINIEAYGKCFHLPAYIWTKWLKVVCVVFFFPDNIFSWDHYQPREEKRSAFCMQLRRKHFFTMYCRTQCISNSFSKTSWFLQRSFSPTRYIEACWILCSCWIFVPWSKRTVVPQQIETALSPSRKINASSSNHLPLQYASILKHKH